MEALISTGVFTWFLTLRRLLAAAADTNTIFVNPLIQDLPLGCRNDLLSETVGVGPQERHRFVDWLRNKNTSLARSFEDNTSAKAGL